LFPPALLFIVIILYNKGSKTMEENIFIYRCHVCNKTLEVSEKKEGSICCEQEMILEPLPVCTTADHPEMARNTNEDLPCDDSTGKI
jgi:hypothetical protein